MDRIHTSPITGRSNTRTIRCFHRGEIERLWLSSLGFDVQAHLRGVQEIALCECLDTGLHFFVPPELAGNASFYEALSEMGWYYPETRWDLDVGLGLLRERGRLLEIGCGNGGFLERYRMLTRAENSSLFGLELNPASATVARSRGLNVLTIPLEDFVVGHESKFEAVCAFQVLEHVPDIRSFLDSACRLLKPGGLLLVAVPNRDCDLGLSDNPLDYPPHHLTRWSIASLAALESFFPFKSLKLLTQPLSPSEFDRFLTQFVAKHRIFAPMLRLPAARRISRFLLQIGLRHCFRGQSAIALYSKNHDSR